MWCPSCRADVAAELSADERRFLCTRCRTELGLTAATLRPTPVRPIEAERDARELLARWSAQSLLDQPLKPSVLTDPGPAKPKPQPVVQSALPVERRRRVRRPDLAPVEMRVEGPTDVTPQDDVTKSAHWMSAVGQLAAYAGIGLLTCGTVLVIWSHFGGPATYAPTGWLVCTLGQMLLFLGVVTLVSGGLEQTNADLSRRIDRLHDHIRRVDSGHGLPSERGPHYLRQRRQRMRRRDAA